ncbi:hypothetical protein WN943_021898 [Citrus x changshan-huyou]
MATKAKEDEKSGRGMQVQGCKVEGLSIAGHETCIIFPSIDLASILDDALIDLASLE